MNKFLLLQAGPVGAGVHLICSYPSYDVAMSSAERELLSPTSKVTEIIVVERKTKLTRKVIINTEAL